MDRFSIGLQHNGITWVASDLDMGKTDDQDIVALITGRRTRTHNERAKKSLK